MKYFDDVFDFYYDVETREKKDKKCERRNRARDKNKKRNEFINEWNKAADEQWLGE